MPDVVGHCRPGGVFGPVFPASLSAGVDLQFCRFLLVGIDVSEIEDRIVVMYSHLNIFCLPKQPYKDI